MPYHLARNCPHIVYVIEKIEQEIDIVHQCMEKDISVLFFLKWHLRTTNVMFRTIFGTHVEIFEKKNQGERGGKGFKKCSGKQT